MHVMERHRWALGLSVRYFIFRSAPNQLEAPPVLIKNEIRPKSIMNSIYFIFPLLQSYCREIGAPVYARLRFLRGLIFNWASGGPNSAGGAEVQNPTGGSKFARGPWPPDFAQPCGKVQQGLFEKCSNESIPGVVLSICLKLRPNRIWRLLPQNTEIFFRLCFHGFR